MPHPPWCRGAPHCNAGQVAGYHRSEPRRIDDGRASAAVWIQDFEGRPRIAVMPAMVGWSPAGALAFADALIQSATQLEMLLADETAE